MDIKKLIREEIDSFDWVSDVPDITKGLCVVDNLHRVGNTYTVMAIKDGVVYLENNETYRLREIPHDVLLDWIGLRSMTICQSPKQ